MRDPKTVAIAAVKATLSQAESDLYAARMQFRACTPKQMQEPYGNSGSTRAEVLASYEQLRSEVKAALEWVMSR